MPAATRAKQKWAVENVHQSTGDRVRLIETHQDWVAKLFAEKANERFEREGKALPVCRREDLKTPCCATMHNPQQGPSG